MLRSLIEINKQASRVFDSLFPEIYSVDGNTEFRNKTMPSLIEDKQKIYDLGGGSRPYVSLALRSEKNLYVVGVDISERELRNAPKGSYDETIAVDLAEFSGAGDGDIAISQAALEHVVDTQKALDGIASTLRLGGTAAIFVPCSNAVFARINVLLPEGIKRALLFAFFPEKADGHHGFPAHYNNCTPDKMIALAGDSGLELIRLKTYWCSPYFTGLFPVHVIWRLWTVVAKNCLGRQMCETFVLILKRIEQEEPKQITSDAAFIPLASQRQT